MHSVLIANSDSTEVDKVRNILSSNYDISVILSPTENNEQVQQCDLVLLDSNFTTNKGIDFLMELVSSIHVPFLMITPLDDPQCAVESMRVGAFNYLVKTHNYYDLLDHAIKEAIHKFNDHEEMKQSIITLTKRVVELEMRLGISSQEMSKETPQTQPSSREKRQTLLEQIVTRLKRGEINLPSYPQINIQFRQLMSTQATVTQIADLLKQDMSIASTLISVSNSSYYKGLTQNGTLEEAISRLGLNVTKNYVEVISNRALYTISNNKYYALLKGLWEHALACAHASYITANLLNLHEPDQVFTMGLLHDIGKLFLLQILAELETKAIESEEIEPHELLTFIHTHHGSFGGNLLKRWKFPAEYSNIAMYHDHLEAAATISKELLVVHFANVLMKTIGYGQEPSEDIEIHHADSTRFLKLTDAMITEVQSEVRDIMAGCHLGFD